MELCSQFCNKQHCNDRQCSGLLGHHDLDELFVVDLSIAINISFADHLVDLLVSELLAQVGHHMTKFSCGDETVAVLVEHFESLLDLFLRVRVLHLPRHEVEELRKVDSATAVDIDFIDHVLELCLSWVLAEGAHDGAQLLGGDRTIAILIKKGESFLEFSDLFLCELVGGHAGWSPMYSA